MAISDDDLLARFSGSVVTLQLASNEGLNGIATAALLIWSANAAGATIKQIDTLVLGSAPSRLLRNRYHYGKGLARYWNKHGMPEQVIRCIDNFQLAREQSLYWLAKQGITRQDEVHFLWSGVRLLRPSIEDQKLRQLSVTIVNACTGNWMNGDLRAGDVAASIVSQLPLQEAEEFCIAATEALAAKGSER
jgi:hypothetical protein